jgi:SM-20-related protein
LFLGIFEFEGLLSIYPPGCYYRKHLDQYQDNGQRIVTCILYLNHNWRSVDGGQLRLYTDPVDETRFEDILPIGGRLVTFLSSRFQHSVIPSRRERLSITGWFKTRIPII